MRDTALWIHDSREPAPAAGVTKALSRVTGLQVRTASWHAVQSAHRAWDFDRCVVFVHRDQASAADLIAANGPRDTPVLLGQQAASVVVAAKLLQRSVRESIPVQQARLVLDGVRGMPALTALLMYLGFLDIALIESSDLTADDLTRMVHSDDWIVACDRGVVGDRVSSYMTDDDLMTVLPGFLLAMSQGAAMTLEVQAAVSVALATARLSHQERDAMTQARVLAEAAWETTKRGG